MLEMVVVWLPHIIWRKSGIPRQPPCPVHGFPDEGEDDFVMPKGMAQPRRFCGVTRDTSGFLVGSLHMCSKCKDAKDAMVDGSEKKAKHYHFRSYNKGVTSQYLRHPKFSFVGSELQLRLTHRRAVTADFERLVCSSAASAGGSRAALQLQNNTKPLTNLFIIHILTSTTCVELYFLEAGRKSRKQLCRAYGAVLGRKRTRAAFGVTAATAARKCRCAAATAAYESLTFLSFLVTAWDY